MTKKTHAAKNTATKAIKAYVRNANLNHAVDSLTILTFFQEFILPELKEGDTSITFYDLKILLHNYVTTDPYEASMLHSFGGTPAVRYTLEELGHDHRLITRDDVRCYIDQTREKIAELIAM